MTVTVPELVFEAPFTISSKSATELTVRQSKSCCDLQPLQGLIVYFDCLFEAGCENTVHFSKNGLILTLEIRCCSALDQKPSQLTGNKLCST